VPGIRASRTKARSLLSPKSRMNTQRKAERMRNCIASPPRAELLGGEGGSLTLEAVAAECVRERTSLISFFSTSIKRSIRENISGLV